MPTRRNRARSARALRGAVDINNLLHSRTTPRLPAFDSPDAAEVRAELLARVGEEERKAT
jgi:hypothetical protein